MRDRDNVQLQPGVPIRALDYSYEQMRMLERWHISDDDGKMSPRFGTEAQALGWYRERKLQRAA